MMVFWVLVVLLVVWAARATTSGSAEGDPLRIVDEQLARGEVEPVEYNERRAVLLEGRR